MKSVSEALNTLISAVNVAHNKGGVYSLEEAHFIHTAISYLNNLQQAPAPEAAPAPVESVEQTYQEEAQAPTDESPQGY